MNDLWELDIYKDREIRIKEFFKFLLVSIILIKILGVIFPVCIVKGQSMRNTLNDEDLVILNRLSYLLYEPSRKDIVIIDVDENSNPAIAGKILVKRVIGLPGEHLEIKDNKVYINGEYLEENYLEEEMITLDIDILIPPKEVFVMGDNRNESGDSRDFGTFKINNIEAKVLFEK